MKKLKICLVEDDPLKRWDALGVCEEEFGSRVELRFLLSEQQFCDLVVAENATLGRYVCREESERWVPVWSKEHDGTPDAFVLDMMVEWDSSDYESGSKRPDGEDVIRAGLRMAKALRGGKSTKNTRIIVWTAIDCRDIAAELKDSLNVELHYKSDLPSAELFSLLCGDE